MLAIAAISAVTVIGSLYVEQQDEIGTRNRIQRFHLESNAEARHLAHEVRTLRDLLIDAMNSGTTDYSGAASIQGLRIGYRGILYSMRSRLARLLALHKQYDDAWIDTTLERLAHRFSMIDVALRDSEITPETLASLEALGSTIEQFDRMHTIAADWDLRGLSDRQSHRPRFLGVLILCLSFFAVAIWYLISSLRTTLFRQKEIETALAESQERLHQVQKLDALGELAGGIAHDFNNLLTAILGNTSLLQDSAPDNERLKAGLEEIRTAGTRAASLTQQFLAFSQRQPSHAIVVDLNELLRNMEATLLRIAGADIELNCHYADERCTAELDPQQIQQVILNLAVNARDAMPRGGLISITTEVATVGPDGVRVARVPDGEYVKLTVSDIGTGMGSGTLQRLFDPYFSTKEKGQGKGLGLSTVHGIITASNGHIVVASKEGEGSQFYIYLPRAEDRPVTIPDENVTTIAQHGSETILVVDDDEQILRFVATGLTSLGYRVLTARGGTAGLEICRSESAPIAAIVSDIVMSEMSGPSFIDSALQVRPGAVAIYMSTYPKEAVLGFRRGRSKREVPLISKPFELESLHRLIRECLDRLDDT